MISNNPFIDEFSYHDPFLVDEIYVLMEALGESIANEALSRVANKLNGEQQQIPSPYMQTRRPGYTLRDYISPVRIRPGNKK